MRSLLKRATLLGPGESATFEPKLPHATVNGKIKTFWQDTPDLGAVMGLRFEKASDSTQAPGLTWSITDVGTGALSRHYGLAMDVTQPELILCYDHAIPQGASPTKSGDTLRIGHGGRFLFGDGIGSPTGSTHRVQINSTSTDDPAMTGAMVKLNLDGTGTSVLGDFMRGAYQLVDVFNINKNGYAAFGGTYSGTVTGGSLEAARAVSVKGASVAPTLMLSRSGDIAKSYTFDVDGLGSLRVRDNSRGVTLLGATTAGVVTLGQAGAAVNTGGGNSLDDGAGVLTVAGAGNVNGGVLTIRDTNGVGSYNPSVILSRSGTITKSFQIGVTSSGQLVLRDNTRGQNVITADTNGNVSLGQATAVLAATATSGFVYTPRMTGAPTGIPVSTGTGVVPMVVDDLNNKLWVYINAAWKGVVLA